MSQEFNYFNVDQLLKRIATLYNSYTFIQDKELIDELRDIAANIALCSTVQNRNTIAVAGMQGTGKTTLVQNLYNIDDKILRVSVERGEEIPVFITEREDISEGQYKATKWFLNSRGTIDEREIDPTDVARLSSTRNDEEVVVCVELFVAPKYFSGANCSFVLLPGFEKKTREELDEEYNRLMKVCLNFSGALLLVVDEQNIANVDIDTIIGIAKDSGFKNTNSVFAITKCDGHIDDKYKNDLKAQLVKILNEKNFGVSENKIICTGTYPTQEENDEWIENLVDAVNGSERPVILERNRKYYKPIIDSIIQIVDDISASIKDEKNRLDYKDNKSPIYNDLIEQKEKIEEKIYNVLDSERIKASNEIDYKIDETWKTISPDLLKEKRLLVFKKKYSTIIENKRKIAQELQACMMTDEGQPVYRQRIVKEINSGKFGESMLLPSPSVSRQALEEAPNKAELMPIIQKNNLEIVDENRMKMIEYYFNKKELEMPVNQDHKELVDDNTKIAELLANSLLTAFLGALANDEEVVDVKTENFYRAAKNIRTGQKSKTPTGAISAVAIGALDLLDGKPDLIDGMKDVLLPIVSNPYVLAALAVGAGVAGGISVNNHNFDICQSTCETAKIACKQQLCAERDRLFKIYSDAFNTMIDVINETHRAKFKIGDQQHKLENAEIALNEIKYICQASYDLYAKELSKGE